MLYNNVIHDLGNGRFGIGPEIEPAPCERCGGESVRNTCGGDGRSHWHGRVHTLTGGLQALCRSCGDAAEQEWQDRKAVAR